MGKFRSILKMLPFLRSRSTLGHSRAHWGQSPSSHAARPQEQRNRSRISTVIQPLRQNAAEVVDLTVDEDGKLCWSEVSSFFRSRMMSVRGVELIASVITFYEKRLKKSQC